MTKNKIFGNSQWGFLEAFIIIFFELITGIIIEIITKGKAITIPPFPYNLIILIILFFYPVLIKLFYSNKIYAWLSGIPMTIVSISVYTVLVITMGSFMQENPNAPQWQKILGLSHISQTWYFLFISVQMMTVLSFTILNRLKKLSKISNITFVLNHLGIWIIIAAASLGTGDLKRVKLVVFPDNTANLALNSNNNGIEQLPFSIKLDSFILTEYKPAIAFVNPLTNEINKEITKYNEGDNVNFNGWKVKILKYYNKSVKKNNVYIPSTETGAVHSILIKAEKNGDVIKGWISAPELKQKGRLINMSISEGITLLPAEVKQFKSKIYIYGNSSKSNPTSAIVSVNHPYSYNNWDIYQYNYDESMERWSKYSVLELVKDPWLFMVYIGIFMLLAGTTLLLWFGKFNKK